MTPTELTAAGYTVEEQVKAYELVATCHDKPADAPRSAWERALRLVRPKHTIIHEDPFSYYPFRKG